MSTSAARAITIDFVTDIICPWCYVGKKRLEKGIALAKEKYQGLEVSISFNPYQLDPAMENGLDKTKVLADKFGDRAEQIFERLTTVGKEEGIEFNFDGKMSNTLDAHRLVDYAKLYGDSEKEDKVVDSLFKRYFELAQDIGDINVLLDAAEEAGLDRAQTKQYLYSDDGIDSVKRKIKYFQSLGVTGVPFYIINDRFGISGAETPETILAAFDKILGSS
ncbi:hypothetical protein GGI12_004704 [Dipsacomyces acuminosporus]|nr:hypothetical protein GGI12_004704 [Dipsacomyces acuminosporus]